MHHLRRCLAGLTSEKLSRIIVVDNASGADEVRELEHLVAGDDRVTLLVNETNVGFGPAVNLAVRSADWGQEDHLWILNPDTVPDADAPDRLLEAMEAGDLDIVSPLITMGPPDDLRVWFAGGDADALSGSVSHALFGLPVKEVPEAAVLPARFITGAAPLMSHATWAALGGFREDLFLYWEDVDLSLRARGLGLRMACLPEARVWHLRGGSSGSSAGRSADFYYYVQRNRILVCRPAAGLPRLLFGRGATEVLRLLAKPVLVEPADRVRKLYSSTRGLIDGIRGVNGRRAAARLEDRRVGVGVDA
ncbi:glycosyltransferase [Myceligenerans sp. I2]|uniref:Glycosyltransferase n=1 Tax=Myceligenerans indicum TaxID=2593663 RepID=A0ABS1LPQ7_9MICO|nr:glycosyltransferase [Myceligenerans indicum]